MHLCVNNQTAFGGMLQHLVELTSIVLRPVPLDLSIERRCKHAWEQAPCLDCGETTINARDSSPRLWYSNCRYTFTYPCHISFEGRTLMPGEIIIGFVLCPDMLLSINQIAQLFQAVYDTVQTRWKPFLSAASTPSRPNSKKMVTGLPRSTKLVRSVLVQGTDAAAGGSFLRWPR